MTPSTLRLYRGLEHHYDPGRVGEGQSGTMIATNFTDCPLTALGYARSPRGVVLVVDVEFDDPKLSRELWLCEEAGRFMLWGRFDSKILAVIPAKQLRAVICAKGRRAMGEQYKVDLLRLTIEQIIEGIGLGASHDSRDLPLRTLA